MSKILNEYSLTVACDTNNLEMIREFVINIAKKSGLADDKIFQLEMAVDEAATNVMKHAYEYDSSKKITIKVKVKSKDLIVEIIDRGSNKFDPNTVQEVNLKEFVEAKKHGGLGIHLIKNLMDDVQYFSGANNYNRVKLVKKLT